MSAPSFKERRLQQRYQTKGDFLFSDCGFHAGGIVNISRGGMCCNCISRSCIDGAGIKNTSKINFFSAAINFYLQIPVKTITKKQKPCEILKGMSKNECHLCFDKLNKNLLTQLVSCIDSTSESIEEADFLKSAHEQLEVKVPEGTGELQKALDEVKRLRWILPICSYCKKIKNDEGYYLQLEAYFQNHLKIDLSHTLCPECFNKEMEKLESFPIKR